MNFKDKIKSVNKTLYPNAIGIATRDIQPNENIEIYVGKNGFRTSEAIQFFNE